MDKEKFLSFMKDDKYAALSGIEIIEVDEGYCKTRMIVSDIHLNAAKVVHGGAIFTLADLAFAGASNSRGQLSLAISANITFLKGKPSGILYATAKEVADPKRIGAYNILVTDENDDIIATFNGLVYRKNDKINI